MLTQNGATIGTARWDSGSSAEARQWSRVEKPLLTCYDGAEDGIRTRDPHLGKVVISVSAVSATPCRAAPSIQFPLRPSGLSL